MIKFKQILCPVDFSESSLRAFAHAVALAKGFEAHLTALHVAPTFEPVQIRDHLGDPVHVPQVSREDMLVEMRRALDIDTVCPDASVVAESGDTTTAIVNHALTNGTDLIVMGTHGRRGFKRLFLGSVTETVLREAPCPVLTVPQQTPDAVSQEVTFKHILCAIDFSPSALQALGFALELAKHAGGRVTLLRVIEWLAEEEPRTSAHFNIPEYRRYIVADAEERLRLLMADESQTSAEVDHVVVFGRAHRQILSAAEANPVDLIVMGAQGRGGVGLALFGSTTQQVVRGATCPVLTVRGTLPS